MKKEIYLDNNSTTKIDDEVLKAMMPFLQEKYGNANSLHNKGIEVRRELKKAINTIYTELGSNDNDDIIITSGATESINWILKGIYFDKILNSKEKKHIITTSVEHPAVLQTCKFLESLGVEITYLPVNNNGVIEIQDFIDSIKENTIMTSIMWVNNETGMIFPIEKISKICKEKNILFATDATQAIGKIKIDLKNTNIDFLAFSAHKFHGPKGVGGLFIKNSQKLSPLFHGGEHMGGRRSGTLNTAGIIGCAKALELANKNLIKENTTVLELKNHLEDELLKIPHTFVVGEKNQRVQNTCLISIRGVEGEAMLFDLNKAGIFASTGSACASEDLEANPILSAIGSDKELAHTAIRLSLSRFNTKDEIDYVIEVFKKSVKRLREISSSKIDN